MRIEKLQANTTLKMEGPEVAIKEDNTYLYQRDKLSKKKDDALNALREDILLKTVFF